MGDGQALEGLTARKTLNRPPPPVVVGWLISSCLLLPSPEAWDCMKKEARMSHVRAAEGLSGPQPV